MRLTSLALADRSQRWWYLSSIQLAGGVISLPVIGIGSHLALSYGVATAITSILIGNLFVLFISYLMIAMSFPRRLNAVENAKQYIGVAGSKIFAVFILTSALGWSGWILLSGAHLLHKHPFFSTLATGSLVGGIASFVLLIGIKGLKNLALFTVIPLFGLLAFLISDGMSEMAILPKSSHLLSLPAIALAISPSIGAIMDYPTFFRHSKTTKDAYIAIGVIFVITCIVEMAGFMLLNSHLDPNQHQLLTFFVILSMITGACWNIYAASVGWESLFPIFKDRTEYAVIGLIATILILNIEQESVFSFLSSQADAMICGLGGMIIALYVFYGPIAPLHQRGYLLRNSLWCLAGLSSILICSCSSIHWGGCCITSG